MPKVKFATPSYSGETATTRAGHKVFYDYKTGKHHDFRDSDDLGSLYRCEIDYDEYTLTGRLHFWEFPVLKCTPCGYWINKFGRKTFVLAGEGKRYARPTKEAALVCFTRRKQGHAAYSRERLRLLELEIKFLEGLFHGNSND